MEAPGPPEDTLGKAKHRVNALEAPGELWYLCICASVWLSGCLPLSVMYGNVPWMGIPPWLTGVLLMLCRTVYPREGHNQVLLLQKGGIPNFIRSYLLLHTKMRYTLKYASQAVAAVGVHLLAVESLRIDKTIVRIV